MMEDVLLPVILVGMIFIAFPWLIFHYVLQLKKAGSLTREDEQLLDDLHEMARRSDERLRTVERIMTAENPNWRSIGCDPAAAGVEDQQENIRRIK